MATAVQWHKVSYYVWKHEKNVDASKPQKTIVCWHGLARNAHDFDVLAQYLVKHIPNATVIAVDTPGRGKSEKILAPTFYTPQTYAVVFMAIWNSLGCPRDIEWVGISMGGLVAMLLTAASLNCPIKKLVLVDIGPFLSKDAVARIGSYVGTDPRFETIDEAEEYFKKIYGVMGGGISEVQWKWMARFLTAPAPEDGKGKIGLHYDPAIAAAFKGAEPKDIEMWALWDLIKVPIMVYHGEKSDVLSFETLEQMKTRGPKVEHVVSFPDQGHTPHLFNYKQCERIIEWFKE